jgi:hypothetical protein
MPDFLVQSLGNSVVNRDGLAIAEVISVTPQSYLKEVGLRGTRVDVMARITENQILIFEVNMYTDKAIHQRSFFVASQIVSTLPAVSLTPAQLAVIMPKIISINILNFDVHRQNSDWLQPAKFVFVKEPITVALPQFMIYDIELPKFREATPDFSDDLYCWIYALNEAHQTGETIKEVVRMTPDLQAFEERNIGFQQFCKRYQLVASDDEARKQFFLWRCEIMRQEGIHEGMIAEGEERSAAKLEPVIAEQKAIIADLGAKNAELERGRAELERGRAEAERKNAELERRLAEAERKLAEAEPKNAK